jgi:hypothetical protein
MTVRRWISHRASTGSPRLATAVAVIGLCAALLAFGSGVASAVTTGVNAFGNATAFGAPTQVNQPIVGMASTPDGHGYWLVAADGGIFTFGDASFFGSTGGIKLNKPVVGMASTPDGNGYWLVASDGGIFTFGDAGFYGSAGNIALNQPIVGMASTPDGHGYWLVASDGGIFTFGDAGFYGSAAGGPADQPTVGMAGTADGNGYWTATSIKLLPTCQPSQLSLTEDAAHSGGAAAGSLGITYVFTNTSATACTLSGFPGLQLLNASGGPLTTRTSRNSETPSTVALQPGRHAWFDIEFPTQTGFGSLQCPTSSALAVIPPNDVSALVVTGSGGQIGAYGGDIPHLMCGSINVSPVLAQPPF